MGMPKIERDLDRAGRNGKVVTRTEECSILGTSILGVQRAPEIARAGTSKARFNTDQLDRREAEREEAAMQDGSKQQEGAIAAVREGKGQQVRRTIVVRKVKEARECQRLEMADAEEAAQALRAAEEAEREEEKEEEAKRQRWDKAIVEAIQAKWDRVGSPNGEAQVIRSAKAHRQAVRAWDKMLTAAGAKLRRARLTAADRDRQHRQDQLRRQQEHKQGRARQQ